MNLMEKYKAKMTLTRGKEPDSTDMIIMKGKYSELCQWLSLYDVTGEDIRQEYPKLYTEIISAIEEMDRHMVEGNTKGFCSVMERIKKLYLQAVDEIANEVNY